MSNPITERVNTTEVNDETRSLNGRELTDVSSAGSSLGGPVTSEEITRQNKGATDLLTEQLELLCYLMRDTSGKAHSNIGKRLVV